MCGHGSNAAAWGRDPITQHAAHVVLTTAGAYTTPMAPRSQPKGWGMRSRAHKAQHTKHAPTWGRAWGAFGAFRAVHTTSRRMEGVTDITDARHPNPYVRYASSVAGRQGPTQGVDAEAYI